MRKANAWFMTCRRTIRYHFRKTNGIDIWYDKIGWYPRRWVMFLWWQRKRNQKLLPHLRALRQVYTFPSYTTTCKDRVQERRFWFTFNKVFKRCQKHEQQIQSNRILSPTSKFHICKMTKLYFKHTKPRSVKKISGIKIAKIIAKFSDILWSNTLELNKGTNLTKHTTILAELSATGRIAKISKTLF